MTISSINQNNAGLLAQLNISTATNAVQNNVQALSSGSRIVSAATDVAALSIGSALLSQVNALNTSLTIASQGSSLLQVADGALAQIQSILQRQQTIATSAQAGTLSDTQRGFLDQEFQNLTQQIDQLAGSTNFNGVSLLNGAIAGSNPLESSTATTATVGGFAAQTGITAVAGIAATAQNGITGTGRDTSFIGDLSKGVFSVINNGSKFDISYTINGQTYSAHAVDPTATGSKIDLINTNATAATSSSNMIEFTVSGDISATYAASNAGATALQTALIASFAGATAYASHTVLTTDATGVAGSAIAASAANGAVYTDGTLLAGFDGSKVTLQSANYSGANLPTISSFTASGFGVGTVLSVTINGQTYSTGKATTAAAVNASVWTNGAATGKPTFYLNGDTTSKEKMTLDFTGLTTSADISTAAGMSQFLTALNSAFGGGTTGGGLSFQVGSKSTDTITITLGSATSSILFKGVAQDVLTAAHAATAGTAVTTALNTISALRATVGAGEERFTYASAAIQSAAQNEGAAKSNLLDTDVAATSTAFATSQVQLQAGIAVLAQANQLQQNLLKLIA